MVGLPMLAVEATQLSPPRTRCIGTRPARAWSTRGSCCRWWTWARAWACAPVDAPAEGQPLLIVQRGGRRVALAVDAVVGDRDPRHPPAAGRGARRAGLPGGRHPEPRRADAHPAPDWLVPVQAEPHSRRPAPQRRRALVVDDSLTARALHRAMLEAGRLHRPPGGQRRPRPGAAADGHLRRDHLRPGHGRRWTARELSSKLRSRRTRPAFPSSSSPPTTAPARARRLAAGADGFISKRECAAGRLLTEVLDVMSAGGAHEAARSCTQGKSGRPIRVLVVDDSPTMANTLTALLTRGPRIEVVAAAATATGRCARARCCARTSSPWTCSCRGWTARRPSPPSWPRRPRASWW